MPGPHPTHLPGCHRSLSGERRMTRRLREGKYLALLAAFMVAAILEPLSVTWPARAQIIGVAAVLVLNVPVYLAVFETRWERGVAFGLLQPLVAATIVHEVVADRWQIGAVVFHGFVTLFLALAVAMILKCGPSNVTP